MASSQEYERSIIEALAVSDANMNTALGTPVRKVISAVAGEMAKYAVDVNTTQTLYALDSVSGTELDYLVGQFGFTRQEAKAAKGTVKIKRDNGDEVLRIAYGSQFTKPATSTSQAIQFQTTAYQELGVGVLSAEIAVIAVTPGSLGNVPADTITYTGVYSTYITVTNERPTTGGRDAETDDDLRTRFLNTVFRNVSGTHDQYLGLAHAHEDVRRVNVIGQECRYNEIVQVSKRGSLYVVSPTNSVIDMDVASPIDLNKRLWVRKTDTNELIERTLYSVDASEDPFIIDFGGVDVEQTVHVSGIVEGDPSPTDFVCNLMYTPVWVGPNNMSVTYQDTGSVVPAAYYTFSADAGTITFTSETLNDKYIVLKYRQVVVDVNEYITIEFDYKSVHNRGELKTVDVFVDGEASQLVSDIQFLDFDKSITQDDVDSWVRKDDSNPTVGNRYLILSRQPLIASTGSINVGTSTILTEGVHFNVLYDITKNAGSVRGADAIELIGAISNGRFEFTNDNELALDNDTPMSIPYYYNSDIETIQTLLESQSVMTMDTLVHAPKNRFFSIALDVMYSARPKNNVSSAIVDALETWASNLPFGAMVQVSDIETVVANVVGVDNVKLNQSGICEYALDGETQLGSTTEDFKLAQNEIFNLRNVIINDRSQQNW